MADLYPLFFTPVFKHYLWGGRNLALFGHELPDSRQVAESWEIASHADGTTVISNGHFAGKTPVEAMNILGEALVGKNNRWALDRGLFPLMVKLLDAEQRLSVQVHPDDAYAQAHEGNELGKAEMWVVLKAKPGASIIYGFAEQTTPESFRDAVQSGTLDVLLNQVTIQAGDHICVPPGTLHAILEGAVLAEVQQNSNATYRVYDWNRTDDRGRARPLHIDKALDVINFSQINASLPQPQILEETPQIRLERLCQNQYFTTERIIFNQSAAFSGVCDGSSLEIWGILSGEAQIAGETVTPVRFCVLPAGLGEYTIRANANSVLLRVYTADLS